MSFSPWCKKQPLISVMPAPVTHLSGSKRVRAEPPLRVLCSGARWPNDAHHAMGFRRSRLRRPGPCPCPAPRRPPFQLSPSGSRTSAPTLERAHAARSGDTGPEGGLFRVVDTKDVVRELLAVQALRKSVWIEHRTKGAHRGLWQQRGGAQAGCCASMTMLLSEWCLILYLVLGFGLGLGTCTNDIN
jgi:hypothetical protein